MVLKGVFVFLLLQPAVGCEESPPEGSADTDMTRDSRIELDLAFDQPDSEMTDETIDSTVEEIEDDLYSPSDDALSESDFEDLSEDAPSSESLAAMELWLETEGGFTGQGTIDITLDEGVMATYDPYGDPTDCTATLRTDQQETLLQAAGQVEWDEVKTSYRSTENPYCCCDQFSYTLTVVLTWSGDRVQTVETEWCDESMMDGGMPDDLLRFLSTLVEMAESVLESCDQE